MNVTNIQAVCDANAAAPLVLIWHADPGHAWLAVPANCPHLAAVSHQVSQCSYVGRDGVVYLEEDCDAGLYLRQLEGAGIAYTTLENYSHAESFIRNCRSWPAKVRARARAALARAKGEA